jgi:hypothetical protein
MGLVQDVLFPVAGPNQQTACRNGREALALKRSEKRLQDSVPGPVLDGEV